jgi:hypothetical protein
MIDHETYIRKVAAHVIETADDQARAVLEKARIVYGAGQPGLRGVTYYDRWQMPCGAHVDLVEICALGESSPVQVAGTVIHELAHVLAGFDAGHGKGWKVACERLGLRCAKAAGMVYTPAALRADIRALLVDLVPSDGKPNGIDLVTGLPTHPFTGKPQKPRPCPLGIGTRGGKSRGKGSGSRLRKYVCGCTPKPVIVRCASDSLNATCGDCGSAFKQE